ncbi:MAG: hypothetical protein MZW92_07810 [Comamonadaceae bacterium]|nr:hypothetical protein [Comamonadaceae bacterium]
MTERYVVFSHGKDSEPWGSKIAAMAEIAREEGFHVESVDYRGIDDPQARVTRLLAFCKDLRGSLVLVGLEHGRLRVGGGLVAAAGARHVPAGAGALHARLREVQPAAGDLPDHDRPRLARRGDPGRQQLSASRASRRPRCTSSTRTTGCSTRSAPSTTSSRISCSRSTSSSEEKARKDRKAGRRKPNASGKTGMTYAPRAVRVADRSCPSELVHAPSFRALPDPSSLPARLP